VFAVLASHRLSPDRWYFPKPLFRNWSNSSSDFDYSGAGDVVVPAFLSRIPTNPHETEENHHQ
jgi:hypothetical protein